MVFAILIFLGRAVRRNLGTFGSLKVNNFFFFVAALIYGALNSGVPPKSAYPFLILLGLLVLFPLSSDPLSRIPPARLILWPLGTRQRVMLRLVSLALSPVLWITIFLMLKTALPLAATFVGLALGAQVAIVAAGGLGRRILRWSPARWIPSLPGRTGELVRNTARQMVCVLDCYVAVALSLGGSLYRFLTPHPDAHAFPILAMLVALALSTYTQGLFSLDGGAGSVRYRLMPLRGWQILVAKDAAYLAILLLCVAPLSPLPGLTFGLTALAIGHSLSVLRRLPQRRWRFTSGRAWVGAVQVVTGFALGFAESQSGIAYFVAAGVANAGSIAWGGWLWDRQRRAQPPSRLVRPSKKTEPMA